MWDALAAGRARAAADRRLRAPAPHQPARREWLQGTKDKGAAYAQETSEQVGAGAAAERRRSVPAAPASGRLPRSPLPCPCPCALIYTPPACQLYEATKRATQDITTHAKEALSRSGLKDVSPRAGAAAAAELARRQGARRGVGAECGGARERRLACAPWDR